jgi:regulatory protein
MFDIKSSELHELVDEVLQICQEKNWQNDERYIEVAVNSLSAKGHGPMKIRQKLLQTTSRSDLISAYLDWGREDWARMAQNVLLKKYGAMQPESLQQKAKWTRFLQSRGFDFDQINLAMRKEFNE